MPFDLRKGGDGAAKPNLAKSEKPATGPARHEGVPARRGRGVALALTAIVLIGAAAWYAMTRTGPPAPESASVDPGGATVNTNASPAGGGAPSAAVDASTGAGAAQTAPPAESPPTDPAQSAAGAGAGSDPAGPVAVPRDSRIIPATFEAGSYAVAGAREAEVTAILTRLRENPAAKVTVVGHASSEGGAEGNLMLSRLRAEGFKAYLVERGVSAERIETEARGSSEPLASNDTSEGRRQNRRVEVRM